MNNDPSPSSIDEIDTAKLASLVDAAEVLDQADEHGRLPGSVFYNPPKGRPVRNLNKDRSLSGKARKKARKADRASKQRFVSNLEDQVTLYALGAVPDGWYPLGHHADDDSVKYLEFSATADENGLPLYERPVVDKDDVKVITEGRIHSITLTAAALCPECTQGKTQNCTGWALNELDDYVVCSSVDEATR